MTRRHRSHRNQSCRLHCRCIREFLHCRIRRRRRCRMGNCHCRPQWHHRPLRTGLHHHRCHRCLSLRCNCHCILPKHQKIPRRGLGHHKCRPHRNPRCSCRHKCQWHLPDCHCNRSLLEVWLHSHNRKWPPVRYRHHRHLYCLHTGQHRHKPHPGQNHWSKVHRRHQGRRVGFHCNRNLLVECQNIRTLRLGRVRCRRCRHPRCLRKGHSHRRCRLSLHLPSNCRHNLLLKRDRCNWH